MTPALEYSFKISSKPVIPQRKLRNQEQLSSETEILPAICYREVETLKRYDLSQIHKIMYNEIGRKFETRKRNISDLWISLDDEELVWDDDPLILAFLNVYLKTPVLETPDRSERSLRFVSWRFIKSIPMIEALRNEGEESQVTGMV